MRKQLVLLLLAAGSVWAQTQIQTAQIVQPLPAAASANRGKTFWTHGQTTTDCTSGTGSVLLACTSDGVHWTPNTLVFQGSQYLTVSEANGIVTFTTAGPIDTIQGSHGVCITGTNPSVVNLCSSTRTFVYSGTNDVITTSDCGNTVIYQVNSSIAATTTAFGTILPSGVSQCNVLIINQSAAAISATPTGGTVAGKNPLAIPATTGASNPFYVELISNDSSPGSWLVGRNNLISPLEVQVNGVDQPNQFKLNVAQGSGAVSVTPGSDGATLNINGPTISVNGNATPFQTRINVYGGFGVQATPDAYGGVRLDCTTCGGSSTTSGHAAGVGSYSSLPGTCTTGDVWTLTGGAYDFATCSNNVWTVYAEGVPLTVPAQISGLQTFTGSAPGVVFGTPTSSGQGYELLTATSNTNAALGSGIWRRFPIPSFTRTATLGNGSANVTNVSDMTNVAVGLAVSGAGILPGTTVAAIGTSSLTLSQATSGSAAGSNVTLTFRQQPIRLEAIFAPPLMWSQPVARFMSFGFMDNTGKRVTFDCGNSNSSGQPYCAVRNWSATGAYISELGGQQYIATGVGTASGRMTMYAAFDGLNITLGFCAKPAQDHCVVAYQHNISDTGLADTSYFTYGFQWQTGADDLNQTQTTWFLGTYAPTP